MTQRVDFNKFTTIPQSTKISNWLLYRKFMENEKDQPKICTKKK